ncbi:hypothetical protein BV210_05960 [Halorientalis sp. IM1011]|uniref:outer membrane protein assembly factor BamB family protein n=1 Tax=Halorientalis sp. IM1011 TaxID=1932360 RepID=UPI00097CD1C3|nr:PQQ-binding-like beta-propeller repeat protein [Halorientalis sp. IM1011]AQL42285.1 hypothetical protein BV210_05960 [Halorientalis sp. IM1011]
MKDERQSVTRRRCLAAGTAVSLAGLTGCLGLLSSDGSDGGEPTEKSPTGNLAEYDGPLQVNGIERVDGDGIVVRTEATVENTGKRARQAMLVVALSHTEAEGSIDRRRPLLLASGQERTVSLAFQPQFFGGEEAGRPEEGEFRFETTFEGDEVVEDYPGLVSPTARSAIDGGASWPAAAYDPGGSAHNPGTTAPGSSPTAAWTESAVEFAHRDTQPVVANGTVYAGRSLRALSVDDGTEQWVHGEPARTTRPAVGDGIVAFGTPEDFRGVDAASGDVLWTVPVSGNIWQGSGTVAEGTVYVTDDKLYAIDAASGDVLWSEDVGEPLLGAPAVADGVVVAGRNPLQAFDAADGSLLWAASGGEPVAAAAVAHDTVFALSESHLVALDLAEGRTRWFAPGPFQAERIAVGNDAVYAQRSRSYRPVAFDVTDGRTKWMADGTGAVLGPPSASDGIVVFNDEDGSLLALDTETGDRAWNRDVGSSVRASVAIADETVYFNEPNGPLYALTAE